MVVVTRSPRTATPRRSPRKTTQGASISRPHKPAALKSRPSKTQKRPPTPPDSEDDTNKPHLDDMRSDIENASSSSPEPSPLKSTPATSIAEPQEEPEWYEDDENDSSGWDTSSSSSDMSHLSEDPNGNTKQGQTEKITPSDRRWLSSWSAIDVDEERSDLSSEEDDLTSEVLQRYPFYKEWLKSKMETTIPPEDLRQLVKSHGRWEFANGFAIENVTVLKVLGEGSAARVFIKRGTIAGREVTYISKEWRLERQSTGFFLELAMFTRAAYLPDLQGDCIPTLIGVYKTRNLISVAFELPHANSWMEAHPDLPKDVKLDILEAYDKIHQKGVLHGDVELRHILIGDDKRVTIIDFNLSQTTGLANEDLGLATCSDRDILNERREVEVLLRTGGVVEVEIANIRKREQERKSLRESRKRKRVEEFGEEEEEESNGEMDDVWEDETHGIISRYTLTEWLKKSTTSLRYVVPGREPNLNALPASDKERKETPFVAAFLEESEPKRQPEPTAQRSILGLPKRCLSALWSLVPSPSWFWPSSRTRPTTGSGSWKVEPPQLRPAKRVKLM